MVGKRKRPAKLKMAPEAQQWFKGLAFFYFPNNDTNAVRERRITKAREHGAEWVRDLTEATHVIVDADLTYKDVEKGLPAEDLTRKIIVNDGYPMECISYRSLLKPDRVKYRVSGFSSTVIPSSESPPSSQTSQRSLQPKAPRACVRKGHIDPTETPPRSDASTQRDTQLSAGNVSSEHRMGSQKDACWAADRNHVIQEEVAGVLPSDALGAAVDENADGDRRIGLIDAQ